MSSSTPLMPVAATVTPDSVHASGAWWRHPWMWLVVGGPAAVVVAAIVTAWIAIQAADPVVATDAYRQGQARQATQEAERGLSPAQQGRNHASTPTADLPRRP